MNFSLFDQPRTGTDEPARGPVEDIYEVELLLPEGHVRGLIEAARERGLTAGALARRLISDFLKQGDVDRS